MIVALFAITDTITGLELLWTGVALLGTFYTVSNMRDAWKSARSASDFTNGRREYALEALRVDAVMVVILVSHGLIGLLAMLISNPEPLSWPRLFIGAALVATDLLLVDSSRRTKHFRRKQMTRTRDEDDDVMNSLGRIEAAGETAKVAARQVATELHASQHRADAVTGAPGEAADAASRSKKEET